MKQSADLPPLRISHDDKSTPHRFRFTKSISPISFLLLLTCVAAMLLLLLPSTSTSLNIETTTGMQVKNNTSSSSSGQCMDLSANQNMESLIQSASQVFVTMPAKAGGSTMKDFTAACMNNKVEDNILSRGNLWKQFLIGSLHVQPFISSHMYTEANFQYLVKSTSRDTLIIHTHREEGSRVISAVKQIVDRVCGVENTPWHRQHKKEVLQKLNVRKNATHCTFDEEGFVDLIGNKDGEVGYSTHRLLTCQTYDDIEESAPQLVFLNYKQIDKLNILLAKRFCPEMLTKLPIQSNVAANKPIKVFLDNKGRNVNDVVVGLDEWLKAKGPALEWTLKLRDKASCQRKTRRMEDELFGCRDEALRVTPESVERW